MISKMRQGRRRAKAARFVKTGSVIAIESVVGSVHVDRTQDVPPEFFRHRTWEYEHPIRRNA